MKFVKVNEVPKGVIARDMNAYLKEFMSMKIKMARVEDHGYKSARIAANCIGSAVKRHVFPIDVRLSGDEVYLVRRDM
jgi:hypothetical protein